MDQVAILDAPLDVVHDLLRRDGEVFQLHVLLHEHERGEDAVHHRVVVYLHQLVDQRGDVHFQGDGGARDVTKVPRHPLAVGGMRLEALLLCLGFDDCEVLLTFTLEYGSR